MQPQFMQDWIQELLSQNGLSKPDGRPLYAYRVTDESFYQLFELLRNKTNIGPNLAARRTSYFAQGWLFYAAEWWKRSYEGGPWSWSPIFKKLKYDDPDPTSRREWVETASAYWRLDDEAIGGKRFLGKVVVNGGLPLNLIQKADGSLSRLLHAVLNEAMLSSSPLNKAQILSQIELQRGHLPKSYRQPMVYSLLEKVISAVLVLKEKIANLGQHDPVVYLDTHHPDWLDEFPLRIDSDSARRLLSKLIRQAVTGSKKSKQPFSIIRQIRLNADVSDWEYECIFDASSRHPISSIALMLNCSEDVLPASLDLVIVSGDSSMHIGQMLRREDDYLIKLSRTELKSELFHRSVRLDVSRLGQVLGSLDIQGSEGPDPLVPWVFEDSNSSSKLLWAGSYKLSAGSCLVLTSDSAELIAGANNFATLAFAKGKTIHRVTEGEIDVQLEGEIYQIKCGTQESELAEGIVWGNNRLLLDSSPSHIFIGKPKLDRVDSDGIRRSVSSSELFWRCNDVDASVESIRQFGIGTLFWRKQGKTLLRLKSVCLPVGQQIGNTIRIEYVYFKETKPTGMIRLVDWPISSVICNTENVSIAIANVGNRWELTFVSNVSPPPLFLSLSVVWSKGIQRISVPFPIEGAFIVDDHGVVIKPNTMVSMKQANHLRVHLRGMQNRNWQINMRIENAPDTQRIPDLLVKLRPIFGVTSQIVRLYDLQDQIQQMLSLTTELDARVRISFEYGDRVTSAIVIARYSHILDRDKSNGWVTLNNNSGELANFELLEQSGLRTLPILEAEQAVRSLKPVFSQETHVGSWDFEPAIKQPGLWLIYPSPESPINARPITWFVPERFAKPEVELVGLKAAMTIQNRDERLTKIIETFKYLAGEPSHKDWGYVQVCVDKFGHLPLASLDLWIGLSQVSRAVVCAYLSLEGFTEKIADRICKELPFEWILTSPQDWLTVISQLRNELVEHDEDGGSERRLKKELEIRLEWIQERYPALHLSVQIGLIRGLGINQGERGMQLLKMLKALWLPNLLINENSDVENFIRRATQNASYDLPAPGHLKVQTTIFSQSDFGRTLLGKFKLDATDWKYTLVVAPMMFAYSIAQDEADNWIEKTELISAIRQYREFDRHWFDVCYKVAMACAFNEGLITV